MTQQEKIRRFASFGMLASGFGIAALLVVFGAMAVYLAGGLPGFDVAEEFSVDDIVTDLSFVGRLIGVVFWLLTDILGFVFCCMAFALFRGFRRDGVFSLDAALRLRRIGWLIFALAPVSMLSEAGGTAAITCLQSCGNGIAGDGRVSISINDMHIYAMIVGVLIVAVGHIFVEAVRVSEENEAFV